MTTKQIIANINGNGGLDKDYIRYSARKDNCSVREYIKAYVKCSYNCSDYVANKVANYYC